VPRKDCGDVSEVGKAVEGKWDCEVEMGLGVGIGRGKGRGKGRK
jgi:hypothetical protein